jgi:hypothetical protein
LFIAYVSFVLNTTCSPAAAIILRRDSFAGGQYGMIAITAKYDTAVS